MFCSVCIFKTFVPPRFETKLGRKCTWFGKKSHGIDTTLSVRETQFRYLKQSGELFLPAQAVWSGSLKSTVGNLFKRHVAVARRLDVAATSAIDVKPTGGAEGVHVVLFGWLGAQDKYLVCRPADRT